MNPERVHLRDRVRYNWLVFRTWLGRGEPFVFRKDGVCYVCFPKNSESMIVSALTPTEPLEIAVMRNWLRKGDVFLDGGANLGTYAAAAAQFVGSDGRVLAIDAGARIISILNETARRLNHPQLRPIHAAIGDHDGEVNFYEAISEGHSFSQSLRLEESQRAAFAERPVTMRTLRSLSALHAVPTPAAVKLDLEGTECDALAHAPESWFGPAGPLWIVEINAAALALFGSTPASIAGRFSPAAFQRWVLPKNLHEHGGSGPPRGLRADENWSDSVYYNLIAVPVLGRSAAQRAAIAEILGG